MSQAGKIGYVLVSLVLLLAVYSVGHYLGGGSFTAGGSLDANLVRTCTHTSVNVSTTRQRALEAFGGRAYARLENFSPSSNDVWYMLSNASTSMSSSTGARLQAGEAAEIHPGNALWKGDVWLLANTSTAQSVGIVECY